MVRIIDTQLNRCRRRAGAVLGRAVQAVTRLGQHSVYNAGGRPIQIQGQQYFAFIRAGRVEPPNTWKIHVSPRLGLRPLERVFVAELLARGLAVEFPVDLDPSAIDPSVPSLGLASQHL